MTKHMESRRTFYQRAYNDHSQNTVNKYIFGFNVKNAVSIVKAVSGEEQLTTEQIIAIKYHSYGAMGLFYELIYETLEMTAEEMSAFLYEKAPDSLKTSFAGYSYKSEEILDSDK